MAANEGIGPYILKLLSLTPPKLGSLSTAPNLGQHLSMPAAHPLPAGTACLHAALSPLLPKAAGCGFFISFRCFFLSRDLCFHVLVVVMEGPWLSQALLMRRGAGMGGLGGRGGFWVFSGVFWVFSGCLIPGSAREHKTCPEHKGWSDPRWLSSSDGVRASVRGKGGFESIWVA